MIGEHVRDKIAASKRKGMWVGGPVPLGYRSKSRKLEAVSEDATVVRKIFGDYLSLGSILELAAALDREGVRPRAGRRESVAGFDRRFGTGALFYLLKNRVYVGEIVYRGEVFRGEHEPIVARGLFDAVQDRLKEQAVVRRQIRRASPSLLAGKIFDDGGNLMSPTHANKKGVRYRTHRRRCFRAGGATQARWRAYLRRTSNG